MAYKILAINPGSTSTKISVANNCEPLFVEDVKHSRSELEHFHTIFDQYEYRRQRILQELQQRNIPLDFNAVVGRGGLSKAVESGVYRVNPQMIEEMIPGCQSFIADPGVVDEMIPEAHITGLPETPRICIWHALNQKAVGRRYAREHNTQYNKLNLIIAHLGGGISFAAHRQGRAIDANNALSGDGPFSPERTGTLPMSEIVRLCYHSGLTEEQMMKKITSQGGLLAHLGTNDFREIRKRIDAGDEHAQLVISALILNVAKAIASEGAVLCGKVDAIILTGGMCYSEYLVNEIEKRIGYLAPVVVYPGQDEMLALTENALAALEGKQTIKEY